MTLPDGWERRFIRSFTELVNPWVNLDGFRFIHELTATLAVGLALSSALGSPPDTVLVKLRGFKSGARRGQIDLGWPDQDPRVVWEIKTLGHDAATYLDRADGLLVDAWRVATWLAPRTDVRGFLVFIAEEPAWTKDVLGKVSGQTRFAWLPTKPGTQSVSAETVDRTVWSKALGSLEQGVVPPGCDIRFAAGGQSAENRERSLRIMLWEVVA